MTKVDLGSPDSDAQYNERVIYVRINRVEPRNSIAGANANTGSRYWSAALGGSCMAGAKRR